MADDLNPTPADSRASAPAPGPAPADPTAADAELADDEPPTLEIVAVVATGTGTDGVTAADTAPAATTSNADGAAAGPSAASRDGMAAASGPEGPARVVTPPSKVSNETPTITKPTPRPRPAPVPRPAPPSMSSTPSSVGSAAAAPARPAAAPRPESDWASEVADRIDDVVAKVRANTSDRLVGIARMVVYGLLAAVMGVTALVLGLILFFRLLAVIPGPVWIPYLGLGAIFVLLGLFFWSKRTAKPSPV